MTMSVVRVDTLVSSLTYACVWTQRRCLEKKSDRVNDRVNAALLNATYALLVSARRTQDCSINYFFACSIHSQEEKMFISSPSDGVHKCITRFWTHLKFIPTWNYGKKICLSCPWKYITDYSRTTGPNIGMFVLMMIHFAHWLYIWTCIAIHSFLISGFNVMKTCRSRSTFFRFKSPNTTFKIHSDMFLGTNYT